MRRLLLFWTLFFGLHCFAQAQIDIPGMGRHPVQNGYAKTLRGETLPYFSIYPDYARTALLTRCTDGKMAIEWETTPADPKEPYVYFSWIAAHSTGTSGGVRNFDLYIDDRKALSFSTLPKNYPHSWSFASADSTRLVFVHEKNDGAADAHGVAYLRVPASRCTPGRPLRLKVVGQAMDSRDWYMTFQYTFEEKIDLEALPFLLRGAPARQPLQCTVLHFGAPDTLRYRVDGGPEQRVPVRNGLQTFTIPVAAVAAPQTVVVEARIGRQLNVRRELPLRPVVRRDIYLVHHAHTDIGYSHYQEDVAAIHTQNIRDALRMIDKTRDYPEGSRFVWNIESLWAVENFLREATPDETQRFVQAVKNGQIGLSALYANVLTGLCSPDELRWWTDYADTLRQRYDLPIRTAMFSDIPGLSWEAVPALSEKGVRYFSNGPNYIESLWGYGDRIGPTLLVQGDRPFWWKSASGRDSLLFWTCGKGYSSWHGFAPGAVFDRGPRKIAAYLDSLEAADYPYDMVQWRYNIVADNGTIDSTISDFVRQWNDTYASPRLVLANVNDVFAIFEKKYGAAIPVWSGEFTPYWEDGAYSTAAEEAQNRLLSNRLSQLEQLSRQTHQTLPAEWWYQAKRHVILFHEHTWGSWNSISEPDAPFTIRQWDYKKRLLDSVRYDVQRIEQALLQPGQYESFIVYNTLPWVRSGVVEIEWPATLPGDVLLDDSGRIVPTQVLPDGRRILVARNVPARGAKRFRLTRLDHPAPGEEIASGFQMEHDAETGSIASLRGKGREWVRPGPYGGLLQAVYVAGQDPARFHLSKLRQEWTTNGPVVRRWQARAVLEGANEVRYEMSQYRSLDLLHLAVTIDKKSVRDKEALHIAFPFALDSAKVRVGVGDAWISPEEGQIPAANHDFFSVERWIDVSGPSAGVTLSCPQAALFEVGAPIDERPLRRERKIWLDRNASSPLLFLYAMNNYWHTNYKADQSGPVRFDIYLHFHGPFDAVQAERWGKEAVWGMVGRWE